jgi:hypothetical protein
MIRTSLNPFLVFGFYTDFNAEQLNLIRETLGYIPNNELMGCWDVLIERWKNKEVGLFYLPGENGALSIAVFYCVDQHPTHRDFAILATIAADRTDTDFFEWIRPQLEEAARKCGCSTMSLRTIRTGMVRKVIENGHGWFCSEITLRKRL